MSKEVLSPFTAWKAMFTLLSMASFTTMSNCVKTSRKEGGSFEPSLTPNWSSICLCHNHHSTIYQADQSDSYKIHGLNLVQFLRGEFAFILYDSERKLLFAARDRFGIKPLYYTLRDDRLIIASEMKALLAYGWKPEWDVHSIVEGGEYNDNRTLFKGVYKVLSTEIEIDIF